MTPVSATQRVDPWHPDAFASPLAIADEIGIGSELRRIIEVSRAIGLHPRPDRHSVLIAPPADKRMNLFTVWPQWDEGGSFRVSKSPAAFAEWVPGVTLDAAQAALGSAEEPGVLLPGDVDALLAAVRDLVPPDWATGSLDERRAALLGLGIEGLDLVPDGVLRVIDKRAGAKPEIALRFAATSPGLDGVTLRPQQGKGDPWYFQVRHPRFSVVVAYAWPRPGEVRIEYRLPGTHDTHGVAVARESNSYGIVLTARDEEGLAVAIQLLRDALAAT
ncbi:MAG: hypothetical protein WCH74_10615 [Chloroflexota bacterium]